MAKNEVYDRGEQLRLTVANTVLSGDPVMVGNLPGVALTDYSATDGKATLKIGVGAFTLSVKGVDDSGNSAVAIGDAIYYVAADTPVLSKKAQGKLFGYALATVTSGATSSITVLLAAPSAPGKSQTPRALRINVGTGAAANTNIAVSGITTADSLLSVVRVDLDSTAANIGVTDVTSEASITSSGNIQLTTTNTTGDKLLISWYDLT